MAPNNPKTVTDSPDVVRPPNDQVDWHWLNFVRPALIAAEEGPLSLGLPERWLEDPHWRCVNGHVSIRYLKSEEFGCDLCLGCGASVRLTFPEDEDDVGAS